MYSTIHFIRSVVQTTLPTEAGLLFPCGKKFFNSKSQAIRIKIQDKFCLKSKQISSFLSKNF